MRLRERVSKWTIETGLRWNALLGAVFILRRAEAVSRAIPEALPFFRRFVLKNALEQALYFLASLGAWSILILLVGGVFKGSSSFRFEAGFLFVLGAAFLAGHFAANFLMRASPVSLCGFLRERSAAFRDLLSAFEFVWNRAREGVSDDLIQTLIERVKGVLAGEDPSRNIRFEAKRPARGVAGVLLAAAFFTAVPPSPLVSGWNRLVSGISDELQIHVSISPKGGRVIYGEPVTVTAELLRNDSPSPRLSVETSEGWEEISGTAEGRRTDFNFKPIIEKVRYKVEWRGMKSPVYVFEPTEPPRLSGFKVRLVHPDYAGREPETTEGDPQIQVLRGARAEIEARSSKALSHVELVTSEGSRFPVKLSKGKEVSVTLALQNSFEFWFDMKDEEGLTPAVPVRYAVTVREDEPPSVRLLAPASDLLAGREAEIPFTFETKDDLGVASVFLRVSREDGSDVKRFLLKKYKPAVREKIDDARFQMGELRTASGEVLNMQIEVQDNDAVAGAKSAFSKSIRVEVQSYEKEHGKIEQDLSKFRDRLLDLLEEQTAARSADEAWKKSAANPEDLNKKTAESARQQRSVLEKTREASRALKDAVSRMERDPLSDFSMWAEHKAIQEAMGSLEEGSMTPAAQDLEKGDWQSAVQEQDQAISELERLSALSEEIDKYGKMKDLEHASGRLVEKGERMEQKLAQGAPMDASLLKALQEILEETQNIVDEIRKQMEQLPKELPEEFMNQPAVKDVKLGEIGKSVDQLAEALKRGDAQAAIQAAKELLKQARAAREAIAKASQNTGMSSAKSVSGKSQEQQDALEQIIARQEDLLSKTNVFESKRREALMGRQRKVLLELAQRQKKAVQDASSVLGELRKISNTYSGRMVSALENAMPKMQNVLKEFEGGNVMFSQKWLEEIGSFLEPVAGELERMESFRSMVSSPSMIPSLPIGRTPEEAAGEILRALPEAKKADGVRIEEKAILEKLKSPPAPDNKLLSPEDQSSMKNLSREQGALTEEAKKLKNEIAEAAAQSALVDPETVQSMKDASSAMKSAEGSLAEGNSESAQGHEQKALSSLRKGQEAMQSAAQKMSEIEKTRSGKGSGLGQVQPRNMPGGRMGLRTGEAKIPGADDYLPPREFREEVLDAMKEKVPKSQEKIIRDYYRKLSQ